MFKWFKKHFIPHEGNNHRPHFLHSSNVRKIVLVVVTLELILFILPSIGFFRGSDFIAAVLPSVLNNLTNEKRANVNLNQLRSNSLLEQAAIMKATDMASKGYFAHTSPEGISPWYWLGVSGYRYAMAGENLAINFTDSRDVTEAWMNSSTHRDNILKQNFTEIGTAAVTGYYAGREAIFVVQYYARPLIAHAPTKITTSPAVPSAAVLGEEVNITASFIEKSVASPKHTADIALLTVFGTVVFALIINFVTKASARHPDLVTNGLVVAAVIFGIYLSNNYLFNTNPVISLESVQVSEVIF